MSFKSTRRMQEMHKINNMSHPKIKQPKTTNTRAYQNKDTEIFCLLGMEKEKPLPV